MENKELDPDKLYYSIGEVAELIGEQTSLIRFWEKEFDIIKPRKNKRGIRQYTKEDIQNIKTIHHLVKDRGYTLIGAKEKLRSDHLLKNKKMEVIDTLKGIKEFLIELKGNL